MSLPSIMAGRSVWRIFQFQETGLLLVILLLGVLLALFGGTVKMPLFETTPSGERQRVFVTSQNGEREPALVEKNKFLNAQNLAQLAKDTSTMFP
ncbi:MAG: hypothetical protein HY735_18030 [Verrucomicrobia bacterium]|nr:hypothetical protein [Verrucomicrobiota bacterium]